MNREQGHAYHHVLGRLGRLRQVLGLRPVALCGYDLRQLPGEPATPDEPGAAPACPECTRR
jgi:hypothetical protein